MKSILKTAVQGLCLVLAFPLALLSGFGRVEPIHLIGAQHFALLPGLPGDYMRIAWYRLTLEECKPGSRIQFGDRTQIASAVQILSGGRQHARGAGAIVMAEVGNGTPIGAGSVVTAPIPPGSVAVGSPARVVRSASGAAS